MSYKLDKSAFTIRKVSEQDKHRTYWLSKKAAERFKAAFYLSCRAYGLDPNTYPRMDKSIFSVKKR